MKLEDLKQQVVPRPEYEMKHKEVMPKQDIMEAIKMLSNRLDSMERNSNEPDNK